MVESAHFEVRVFLSGEYDVARVVELSHELIDPAVAAGSPVVVADVSDVTFMDSSGLLALLKANAFLVSRGGRLRLCHLPRPITRLLAITDTLAILGVDEPELAVKAP